MKRLVYRPKVWAYVKTDKQALDLSPYIVSGSIDRVINAPSSASLTLRNPDFMFTTPGSPTFHPMDPITIYMARNISRPVRVFTGFLDTTPYMQLFPGTVTLEASCTMKKLKHTYWDPALPFSTSFIQQYGWTFAGDGVMRNTKELAKNVTPDNRKLGDGGFQNILFGVLEAAGGWNEKDIFIEELPANIIDTVTEIFDAFKQENKDTKDALKAFLKEAIGETAAGAAAASPGPDSSAPPPGGGWKKILCTVFGNDGPFKDPYSDPYTARGMGYRGPITKWSYGEIGNNALGGKPPGYKYLLYANGKQVVVEKKDRNDSNPGDGRVMDIWIKTARWLWPNADYRKYNSNQGGFGNNKFGTGDVWIKEIPQNTPVGPYENDQGENAYQRSGATPKTPGAGRPPQGSGARSSRYNRGREAPTVDDITGGSALVDAATDAVNRSLPEPRSGRQTVLARTSRSSLRSPLPGELPTTSPGQSGKGPTPARPRNSSREDKNKPLWPVPTGMPAGGAGSQFGAPRSGHTHEGLDFPVPNGTSIFAVLDGKVTIVQTDSGGYGKWIELQHANNIKTRYGHLQSFNVRVGDSVTKGDLIAKSNNTGGSTGPHLHFEYIVNGVPKDPAPWLDGSDSQTSGTNPDGTSSGGGGGGISREAAQGIGTATAFATTLEMPSMAETLEALGLQGQKSYLNDKPLIDFVEQLCTSSMRHYMSLPDGRFYAFFPDHFGTFRPERGPYWEIDDIELLEGSMSLSDEELKTHVYVVGDTAAQGVPWEVDYADRLFTAGVVTIFNAFQSNWLLSQGGAKGKTALFKDASTFLARYGVRPDYHPEPLIRSHFYEAFCALNRFMFLWSRQFLTQFQFTFMPELYPGGRVAFKDHDIVCYVDSVQHQFDYTGGFQTFAQLSAPSAKDTNNDGMMEKFTYGMVQSFDTADGDATKK